MTGELLNLAIGPFRAGGRNHGVLAGLICALVLVFTTNLHAGGASGRPAVNWDALTEKEADLEGLLVGFKPEPKGAAAKGVTAKQLNLHAKAGGQLKRAFTLIPVHAVRVPKGKSLKEVAAIYAADPDVAYVEPNYKVYASAIPNDPQYGDLWGMPRINAPEIWDQATGSSNILVAVIDTGILRTHEDLAANMWQNPGETGLDDKGHNKATNKVDDDGNGYVDDVYGWDFANEDNNPTDDDGHGTHVAGTIGAIGNNAKGVVGVNWTVRLVALKFLGVGGGTTENAIRAVQYATTAIPGVRLSNNSWGGGGYSQALRDAIDAAGAAGQLFIAAAGNESMNNDLIPHYPSSYSCANIISVASIAQSGSLSSFSCFGLTSVDIAAPGSDILSTWSDGGYNTISGTSMATPHVAGAAALLWSMYPALSRGDIQSAILAGARANPALTGLVATGGELDLVLAKKKMNRPVITGGAYVSVEESATTNLAVSLLMQPATNIVVSVSWLSGSTNLYVVGSPVFTFTPTNWDVPQIFTVGARDDFDMTNEMAVIQMAVTGDEGASSNVEIEQLDKGDNFPPKCVVSGAVNADRSEAYIDFLFDEKVSGFDGSDIIYTSNVAGGVALLGLADIGGSNILFRATFACSGNKGAIHLTVPGGSLTDQSVLLNTNLQYDAIYTLPAVRVDFADTFDGVSTSWTRSTNVFASVTEDGWSWGPPMYDSMQWAGPDSANSPPNCWGVMKGPFDRRLEGWIQSPLISVGENPVLKFQLWLYGRGGSVEVNGGSGWVTVAEYISWSTMWTARALALDNNLFGNRTIQIRFRASGNGCAMYVDDVTVESQRPPSVCVVAMDPGVGEAGQDVPVAFTVYNSTTATLSGVTGMVSCPDDGVSIVAGAPVIYGDIPAGGVVTGGQVTVRLASADYPFWASSLIRLQHQAMVGDRVDGVDVSPFTINGLTVTPATNLLTVRTGVGMSVTNWMGVPLPGNGGIDACLFQVIYAGANGVADAPDASGQTTGDDHVLYSSDGGQPYGRIGEGAGVVANYGAFLKTFSHNLPSNALVYVRAWDASSFQSAVAYGDSVLTAITQMAVQTNTYGGWGVNRPAPGSFSRDSNGDSVPDGWCVLGGVEALNPVAPLGCKVLGAKAITDFIKPNRVAVSSNYVFVADTENSRVQVWDRDLNARKSVLGSSTTTEFSKPAGIAVTRDGTRLAVADTLKNRIRLFSVDSASGALIPLLTFGSAGTEPGQFNNPMAVAFGNAGEIYVADSKAVGVGNNRVQVFSGSGEFLRTFGETGVGAGQFNRLLGMGVGADGELYVADGPNHRVQAFANGETFDWAYGAGGSAAGQFNWAWDAQPGVGGLLYVTDLNNNRVQILNTRAGRSVAGMVTNAGYLGNFSLPRGAAPAPDRNELYVADTYNSRVIRLKITLDADGDGMDDVWENLHGLNSNDPADGWVDTDGDGVSNVGEYRAGTDPNSKDTDGDGAGDSWEMANALNPLVSNAIPANIPALLTLTATPAVPVMSGQTVLISVTYSQPITNVPSLTLSGALALGPVSLSGSGVNWSYSYLVPTAVVGVVNGTISGAIGYNGYLSDPPSLSSNALFTIVGEDLRISVLEMPPALLGWQAMSGGIYQVQYCTNLVLTNWMPWTDGLVTSEVNDLITVTNAFPMVDPVQFMRVLRLVP